MLDKETARQIAIEYAKEVSKVLRPDKIFSSAPMLTEIRTEKAILIWPCSFVA